MTFLAGKAQLHFQLSDPGILFAKIEDSEIKHLEDRFSSRYIHRTDERLHQVALKMGEEIERNFENSKLTLCR